MIKFFRNIRQKMLTENKFSKYLIYALGEIILVVIGILIALQINNWNQDRIEHKETKVLLSNLKLDIVANISKLKEQQNGLRQRKEWADFVLKSLKEQRVADSAMFITAITRVGWIIDYSQSFPTYNEIVSSGKLSYIKSESLKKALANYQTQVEDYWQIISSYNLGLKETERLAIGHLNGMPEGSNVENLNHAILNKEVRFNLSSIAEDTEFYKSVKHISFYTSVNIDYISSIIITKAEELENLIIYELKTYGE
ncbi:DUF6090 family protein [Lutimonas vermicola]|uniref:DUF6090 family protein n=1 Tax=Lutimonas vermicola TaxID=414288 RepID=A0ABU9KYK2_9FLAO